MKLRILLFSDLHGNYRFLYKTIKRYSPVDLVLFAGDITHFGPAESLFELHDELSILEMSSFYTVLGNCDPAGQIEEYFDQTCITNISKDVIDVSGVTIAGLDGGLSSVFRTINEYEEEDYEEMVDKIIHHPLWKNDNYKIILSHVPPYGYLDRVVYKNIGSKSLVRLIGETNLFLCGHVHEKKGSMDIPNGKIINPGPYRQGDFALVEVTDKTDIDVHFLNLKGEK